MTLPKTCSPLLLWILIVAWLTSVVAAAEPEFRRLPVETYRDKMKAGWIGQIIGVSWGAPTEGKYRQIMPAEEMPPFSQDLVNHAFGQDDLYVEMTFLHSLEQHGLNVSIRQAGIDFANSGYPLWVANDDYHLLPLRLGFGLQSIQLRRRSVYGTGHFAVARPLLQEAERTSDLQPHRIQLSQVDRRLRAVGSSDADRSRRTDRRRC